MIFDDLSYMSVPKAAMSSKYITITFYLTLLSDMKNRYLHREKIYKVRKRRPYLILKRSLPGNILPEKKNLCIENIFDTMPF